MDRYRIISKQLNSLGYKHFLPPDSLPLIEEIIKDLIMLKELNEQYKKMNEKVEREKRNLEKALEPYKQDNGRLILENNDLQNKLYNLEQEHEKEVKEIRKKIREKEIHKADLEFILNQTLEKVKELDKELFDKNIRLSNLVSNKSFYNLQDETKISRIPNKLYLGISDNRNTENTVVTSKPELDNVNIKSKLAAMENRIDELLEEIEELKLDNHHQSDIIAALKCQVNQKDKEIGRLKNALSGGRPLSAVSQDFCSFCSQKEFKIKSLKVELDEAVEKQHEAMNRALQLVEKNQLLERELHDIDNIALAVEEECQNKVKHNIKNVQILQEKLRQKCEEIKKLEDLVSNMKKKIERDELELDSLRKEKEVLEKNLQIVSGEKKALNDKINHFLLMEKNLNSKVGSLQEINKSLQRQIGDMEGRVMNVLGTKCNPVTRGKAKKYNSALGPPASKIHSSVNIGAKSSSGGKKSSSEELTNEDPIHISSSLSLLDRIQNERDFYHNECHRLKDQLYFDNKPLLMKQQKEFEQEIADLKQNNFMLRHENSVLVKRLECNEYLSCSSGDSIKIIVDKLEKERDMALSDITRLQSERDSLKERIKTVTECQLAEQSRLEKIIRENEERIRRLETERRELINSQSSQRIALTNMEEKCDEFREKARKAQSELTQMTANYNQLKTLQEQTDRSLSDAHSRHTQADIELRASATKIMDLQRTNSSLESEISQLKKEKATLMSNLTFIEKEKDGLLITLDEKTEKVAKLEAQIKKKDDYVRELNEKVVYCEKKIECILNEKTSREFGLRSLEREVEHLKEELQQCERQKEALVRENRRLQDDLSSAAKDCLTARRDFEAEKEEVENLKKQLQQYVSEVKKAEELLTKKESERNQMLEHFRSLSIEATTLESNNHTLESTVENTKTQLNSANNKIMDLERQLEARDTLLFNYEKQIAELTAQIAELETKLKIATEAKIRAEEDLATLRELCSSLDGQKEALRKQANNVDAEKIQLANEVRRLSEEYEGLNQKLTHERTLSQTLEKSLTNSRQETLEHKITNKDLQTHVQYLRQKVDELTQKLETESQDVRRYQTQCADLSKQVSELRREVTNARFERAKALEDSRRSVVTTKHDSEEEFPYSLAGSLRSLPSSSRTFTCSPEGTKQVLQDSRDPLTVATAADPEDAVKANEFVPGNGSRLPCTTIIHHLGSGQYEEEAKDISFEGKSQNDSQRNIPPLTFQGDSERTESFDSDSDYLKLFFGEPGKTYRKPCILSPLLEKFEGTLKEKEDTASELSSLPEDSGSKLLDSSFAEGKSGETSTAHPTYSVRNRYLCDGMHFTADSINKERNFEMDTASRQKFRPITGRHDKDGSEPKYSELSADVDNFPAELYADEGNKSCSECEFQKYIWGESPPPAADVFSPVRSASAVPPPESPGLSALYNFNNRHFSDADDNTFSVYNTNSNNNNHNIKL